MNRKMKRLMWASIALNVLFAAGIWHKTADTRAYYQQQLTLQMQPMASEPPAVRLADAPDQPSSLVPTMVKQTEPALGYGGETGKAFAAWRERGREALASHLGYRPAPFGGKSILTERTEFPTFTREKHYMQTRTGLWLPAYLLVPKGVASPRPAVLALPGHDAPTDVQGRGAASIAGQDSSLNYMRAFGLRLVEEGYVVLAADVIGVGELRDQGYKESVNGALLLGIPIKRMMLEQVHEALDFLLARPEVDPERTGAMGISMGGELAMFAGALDPRVKYVVSSGFFYSYRDYALTHQHSLYIPGILNVLDIPDVAGLVAPRPMLLQIGEYDRFFKTKRVPELFETTQRAYQAAGAPSAVALEFYGHSHVMGTPPILTWMKRTMPVAQRPL